MILFEEAEQELLYDAATLADGAGDEVRTTAVANAKASLATLSLEVLQDQHAAGFRAGRCQEGWLKFLVLSEELTARGLPPAVRRLPEAAFVGEHCFERIASVFLLTDFQWLAATYPKYRPAFKTWERVFLNGNWRYWSARTNSGGAGMTKRLQYIKQALRLKTHMAIECRALRPGSVEGFVTIKLKEAEIGRKLDADREASLKGKNSGRFAVADASIVKRRQFFWLCKKSGLSNAAIVKIWSDMGGIPVSEALVSVDAGRAEAKLSSKH